MPSQSSNIINNVASNHNSLNKNQDKANNQQQKATKSCRIDTVGQYKEYSWNKWIDGP